MRGESKNREWHRKRESPVLYAEGEILKKLHTFHGAGILCWRRDESGAISILLGKRSAGIGKWTIPGGTYEKSDGHDEKGRRNYKGTAIRETHEEMGLEIENCSPLWSLIIPYFHYEVFSCQIYNSELPQTLNEFSEVAWFLSSDLPTPRVALVDFQVKALMKEEKRVQRKRERHGKKYISKNFSPEYITAAHKATIFHKQEILNSNLCTCFYCGYQFNPHDEESLPWLEESRGREETLQCPACAIDCVIGEASGFPITDKKFIRTCSEVWFGGYSRISDGLHPQKVEYVEINVE